MVVYGVALLSLCLLLGTYLGNVLGYLIGIDANVGGEIARAVGEKMARLGKRHQVVAITHFPQVSAVADHHFVVSKDVEDGRTCSRLVPVTGEERITELVRMLGGGGKQDSGHTHRRTATQARWQF